MSFAVLMRLAAALAGGILLLALPVGYLARTPMLSGEFVAEQLAAMARANHINLTVNSYRPAGFVGLRLEEVQLVARRGDFLVLADLGAVEIQPSLGALFSQKRLHPATVDVFDGRVHLVRAPAPEQPAAPDQPTAPAVEGAAKPTPSDTSAKTENPTPDTPAARTALPPMRAVLHQVAVSADLGWPVGATQPFRMHRAEFEVDPGARENLEFRHAYGELPDGVTFVVKARPTPHPTPPPDGALHGARRRVEIEKAYEIQPATPTRLDRWFRRKTSAAVTIDALEICPGCAPRHLKFRNLQVETVGGTRAATEQLTIMADSTRVALDSGQVLAQIPIPGAPDEPAATYRVDDLQGTYELDAHGATLGARVHDAAGGGARISARGSRADGVLDTDIVLRDFRTAGVWPALGLPRQLQGGVISGEIDAKYQADLDLAEVQVGLDIRDLTMALPLVTDEPLGFGRLGLRFQALLQPRARSLSATDGEAVFGDAAPINFSGYALDAGRGLVFDANVRADDLHPQPLRDGLPPTIARLALGSEFSGKFGFSIHAAGHTAFPDGLTLAVDFRGEVQVRGDSRYADVLSLASTGPPPVDLPGTLARRVALDAWTDYGDLPPHLPRVLAAAEDARFFSHDGFDWSGLRRALIFNVREGGVKRGGSTLSQQLSKNLFLDHHRTLARKLQEAYMTWRLEAELSKERIMELYLNVVDWGPGIQGIKHAAWHYFAVPVEELSVARMSLLAAVLPGPALFGRQVLAGYLPTSRLEKMEHILSNLRFMRIITPAEYTQIYQRARRGWVEDLKLTVCDDDASAPPGTPVCP